MCYDHSTCAYHDHSTGMYHDHSTYMDYYHSTCMYHMYHDHSTCIYYDRSTCMYYDLGTCMYRGTGSPQGIWAEPDPWHTLTYVSIEGKNHKHIGWGANIVLYSLLCWVCVYLSFMFCSSKNDNDFWVLIHIIIAACFQVCVRGCWLEGMPTWLWKLAPNLQPVKLLYKWCVLCFIFQ